MLVELKDGGIKDIYTDTESYGGCDTCDWGSEYVNEFTVYLTQGDFQVKIEEMYDYAVSEDYLMKLFLTNIDIIKSLTEQEFCYWLKNKLVTDFSSVEELKIDCGLIE